MQFHSITTSNILLNTPVQQTPSNISEHRIKLDDQDHEEDEHHQEDNPFHLTVLEEDEQKQQRAKEEQAQQLIRELQERDREVRQHEQAHAIVGGVHTGSPRYEYAQGPDGKFYAVAGEVSVDTSPVPDDPEQTIAKAEQIRAAALAPAEPSAQDQRVANEALQMQISARAELRAEEAREQEQRQEEEYLEAKAEDRTSESSVSGSGTSEEVTLTEELKDEVVLESRQQQAGVDEYIRQGHLANESEPSAAEHEDDAATETANELTMAGALLETQKENMDDNESEEVHNNHHANPNHLISPDTIEEMRSIGLLDETKPRGSLLDLMV